MKLKGEKTEKQTRIKKVGKRNILPSAILMALIAALIVYFVLLNAEKEALNDYAKGMILVAVQDIPKGQQITEENVSTYFTQKEIDKDLITDASLTSADQAIGLLAAVKLDKGTILSKNMFDQMNEVTSQMQAPVIAGLKADDLFEIVGGILRSSDRINIYIENEETGEVSLVWENVFVDQVFDSAGSAIPNDDSITAAQRINIILEKSSTEQFYSALAAGAIRITKVYS
jgi:hypothetical protein